MKVLHGLVLAIAVLTLISGTIQAFAPGFILGLVHAAKGAEAEHFFAIIGMFMILFGAMLCHALIIGELNAPVMIWSGAQKVGASIAVGLGVYRGFFGQIAWIVALTDFLSAVLIFAYLWRKT